MALIKDYTTISSIHRQLFHSFESIPAKHKPHRAFLIHSSVFLNVRKVITRYYGHDCFEEIWPYQLQIGDEYLDMNLVITNELDMTTRRKYYAEHPHPPIGFVKAQLNNLMSLMSWLISIGQNTFIFEDSDGSDRLSLYTTVDEFHFLQKFIKTENLQNFIVETEVRDGINSHDKQIKIVTFNKDVNKIKKHFDVSSRFRSFLEIESNTSKQSSSSKIFHYYITFAFEWLQPSIVGRSPELFDNDRSFLGLIIYLQWLRNESYTTKSFPDIVELCTMHYTFCNFAIQSAASQSLSIEIEVVINQSYEKLRAENLYIQEDQFDIFDYAVDRKCERTLSRMCDYIQYHFQHLFKSIKIPENCVPGELNTFSERKTFYEICTSSIKENKPNVTLKLSELKNDQNSLNKPINAIIDGTQFLEMNIQLLSSFLENDSVRKIILDTNYIWISPPLTKSPKAHYSDAMIILKGTNKYNFTDHFITDLKTMDEIRNLELEIEEASLPKNYLLFLDNLFIAGVTFGNIKIESSMLRELLKCHLSEDMYIKFKDCKIENSIDVWLLLDDLPYLTEISLDEDETTWDYMFRFIENRIIKFELNEYKFKFDLTIRSVDICKKIAVNELKFVIDEYQSRLIIRNESNKDVDLHNLKKNKETDDDDDNDDDDLDDNEFIEFEYCY